MKRKILVLSMVMALLSALVAPTAVLAAETTEVSGSIPAVVITVAAPSAISLSELPYEGTAQQVVVTAGTPGSVTTVDLRGKSFYVTVAGDSTKLTETGSATLTNALMIATGDDAKELGDVSAAAALSSGAYSDPGAVVVALTGSAQSVATGLTATLALKLTAFQKMDANEDHVAGSYTLTLTYAGTVTE